MVCANVFGVFWSMRRSFLRGSIWGSNLQVLFQWLFNQTSLGFQLVVVAEGQLLPCLGRRWSQVRILSPRPIPSASCSEPFVSGVPFRVPKKAGSAIDIGIAATVNNNFVPALVRAPELCRLRASLLRDPDATHEGGKAAIRTDRIILGINL